VRRAPCLAVVVVASTACGTTAGENQPPAIASFTAAPELVGVGEPVDFSAIASDADGFVIAHVFTFADGTPSISTASPGTTHAFATAGRKTVRVLVTDDDGASVEAFVEITVTEEPSFCDPGLAACGGACVDLSSDENHCGRCGEVCDDGSCEAGVCVAGCLPPEELCDGFCTDTTTDPAHCGDCETECDQGLCQDSACLPPGTVVSVLPPSPAPGGVTRGLTVVGGRWFLTSGLRFMEFEPTTGASLGEWFIADPQTRRGYGLCTIPSELGPLLVTGSFDRFGDPRDNVRLDVYQLFIDTTVGNLDDVGGGCAADDTSLFVYSNELRALLVFDLASQMLVAQLPVDGLAEDDWFTDLALDGRGGAWLTRPRITIGPQVFLPIFAKVDLGDGTLLGFFTPPGEQGVGGIELEDGFILGIGADGTFQIVP
jgi:hypothetical protein